MTLFVDVKYVLLLSSRLERYTRKSEYLWNCRCPFCGDSTSSKTKARGYIFRDKKNPTALKYKCHNCQYSANFSFFLKSLDKTLYKEYLLEKFKKHQNVSDSTLAYIEKVNTSIDKKKFNSAILCSELPSDHPCIEYLESREIPELFWPQLLYTDDYRQFIFECLPNCDKNIQSEPRLIIPYYNTQHELMAATGRALNSNPMRYVTIRFSETAKLIYGLDRLDNSKKCYIVEGPLDSLFLPNAIASGDSNLITVARSISCYQPVLVYDNERRNKENVKQLESAIKEGFHVVIWPDTIKEKDINAMVLSGKTASEIKDIIDTHTVSGLSALVKLNFWKRS
jgi:hypothetical protein